jgi:membrane protein
MPDRLRQAYHHLARSEGEIPKVRYALMGVHGVSALVRAIVRDELPIRAATLSYWTLVAIIPVLLLAFSLMGPLGLLEGATDRLKEILFSTVLSASVVEVGAWIDGLLQQVRLQALGAVGFLGVLLTGSKMYLSAEQTYNDIFKVRLHRSWILRMTLFYALVTLSPLLMAVGFVVTSKLPSSFVPNLFGRLLPISLTTVAFVLGIKLLPQAFVKWSAALTGGLCSAVLFEVAKVLFGLFTTILNAASTQARLYGFFAVLPVFLLWLYLVWLIALLGVELAYVVQNANALIAAEKEHLSGRSGWRKTPDGLFGLQVMLAVTACWKSGHGGISESDVAAWLGVPGSTVADALGILENAELLTRAESGGWLPARPVEDLSAAEVVRAYREASTPTTLADAPGSKTADQALNVLFGSLDGMVGTLSGAATESSWTEEAPRPDGADARG